MADHDKPVRHSVDPGLIPAEIPQGAVAIGESHLHETSEIELRPIITTTIVIVLIAVVSMGLMWGLNKFWMAEVRSNSRIVTPLQELPPDFQDPKLQVDEPSGLASHRDTPNQKMAEYKVVEPGRYAAIPVEEAMRRVAATGALPTGPEWTLRPGEQMIGGVIMNAEQVQYANTPPSQAYVDSPGGGAPAGPAPAATAPAAPAPAPTKAEPAAKAATPTKP